MPNKGDFARGHEVGKKDRSKYIYSICPDCQDARWIMHRPGHTKLSGDNICKPCKIQEQKLTVMQKFNKHQSGQRDDLNSTVTW